MTLEQLSYLVGLAGFVGIAVGMLHDLRRGGAQAKLDKVAADRPYAEFYRERASKEGT